MLIWLNGAFGAGKTTVARELCQRYPNALIFDPEQIGFLLRRTLPAQDRLPDFQDMPLWRDLTVATAVGMDRQFRRPLLVPMTLAVPVYFDEVMTGLAEAGLCVQHFTLVATPRTLRLRLLKRWSSPQSKLWTMRQVGRCASSLADARFATHLATDDRSVREIVDEIASHLPSGWEH